MSKDNFSSVAAQYAAFRPDYPPEMIDFVLSKVAAFNTALDVATGNGQLAEKIEPHFKTVFATDISAAQLSHVPNATKVQYSIESAEKLQFEDAGIDLLTVGQAIHWFDFERFYSEVRRVLSPNGVIAVLGYGLLRCDDDDVSLSIAGFYDSLRSYWDPQRRFIDEGYRSIPFPFRELAAPKFENTVKWDVRDLCGYLQTWSAVKHFREEKLLDPLAAWRPVFERQMQHQKLNFRFPMLLRIGTKN